MPFKLSSTPILLGLLLTLACSDEPASDDDVGDTDDSSTQADTTDGSTDDGSTDDTTDDTTDDATETGEATIVVSGDAFAFSLPGEPYGLIADATISVLEQPEFSVTTDATGHFEFPALPAGSTATFVLDHPDFPPARTKTFTLPESGELERVTFQVPDLTLFDLIAGIVQVEIDPSACQIVSTITRVGKSIYDAGAHGEAGATVTITPAVPGEQGPIYFNDDVIPDTALTESSTDGGVLFVNVPPGVYELQAHKDGVEFESVTMQCAAGVLVNASPPYGLQALP